MKLSLKYPVKPYIVNQKFGESQACVVDGNGPISSRKVVGKINNVCPVGTQELYPLLGMKAHTGIDLHAVHGQTLYYCGPAGVVKEVSTEIERGLGIGVLTNDTFEYNGEEVRMMTRYWHLNRLDVKEGDTVYCGDILGTCDNTGLSAGDHLHFEVKPKVIGKYGGWINRYQDNGYFGSIDPVQFFDGTYAVEARIKILSSLIDLSKKILAYIQK